MRTKRHSADQPRELASGQQRNLNTIERTSPSGSVTRIKGQVVYNPASAGAAAVTIDTLTLPGVKLGDLVVLTPPAAGFSVAVTIGACYVSAADTLKVPLINPTAGALDAASVTCEYVIFRATPNSA